MNGDQGEQVEVVHLGVIEGRLAEVGRTVVQARALSAAELLDRFLTDLDTWVMRADEPTGCLGVLSPADARRFATHWLPAGQIPPPADLAAIEDAQCLTMRAAAAHLDALTTMETP